MTAIATKNSKVSDTIDEIVWKVQIKGASYLIAIVMM